MDIERPSERDTHTNTPLHIQLYTHKEINGYKDRDRQKETEIDTEAERQRQRWREKHSEIEIQRAIHKHIGTARQIIGLR